MLTLMPAAKSTARCGTKTRTGFPHTKDTDHTISAQAFRAGGWAQATQGAPAQRGMTGWRDMFHTVSFLVPRPRSPFVDGTAAGCGTSHPAVLPFTLTADCSYPLAVKHGDHDVLWRCIHGGFPVNSEEEGVGRLCTNDRDALVPPGPGKREAPLLALQGCTR